MDCKYVKVNTVTMKNEAAQLREIKNDLAESFKKLYTDLDAMDSMWEGPAKDAFTASVQEDKLMCDKFYAEIEEFIVQMEDAAGAYEKCENEVYDFLSKINV